MAFDRFMIAPEGFTVGLETDKPPFLIPDEAFASLDNCYVFRGRVRKRFGSYLMGDQSTAEGTFNSRLAVFVGMTDGAGNLSGNVPGAKFAVGQAFTIGTEIFTVYQTGTPAAMLKTGSTVTATYNTNTGAFVFAGAAINTAVYFYPATPVMGLTIYENGPINNQPSIAFDTQFAYTFNAGSWTRSGSVVFTGNDDQFFWAANWYGDAPNDVVLFVTNFNPNDSMYYFNGITWTSFSPITIFLTAGNFVQTARIIVPFKNRLLLLNTVESTAGGVKTSYLQRCRYSQIGSPLATNAWLEPRQTTGGQNAAGAGFIDATTDEEIISAEFIKDRLIVYFEKSTWELAYTNNNESPFLWQKINTELGSEATFSTVPFDKVILTIGNTGVHACSGANVERIDNKIPQEIFNIEDKSEGVKRIAGIRDYFAEMVYWTFPATNRDEAVFLFPNKVLVYNYQNATWAFNDDSITTFGYFEQQLGTTWQSNFQWQDCNFQWVGGATEANFRQVIAGNQEGYIFIVDPDYSRNAPALQITQMAFNSTIHALELTVINHNLQPNDYVMIENAQGMTGVNGLIMPVTGGNFDINHIELSLPVNVTPVGNYTGGGTLARVSNIQIISKQWNPYLDKGQNVYVAKIDFGVLATTFGEITVEYATSTAGLPMLQEGMDTGAIMGNGVLETRPYPANLAPLEQYQERLWHPIYFQSEGECIQIVLYFTDAQMRNPQISQADFDLQGMVLHTQAISTRLQ